MTKILLFLWFPLSVGIVHGMNTPVAAGMVLQHLLLLLFPVYAIVKGVLSGDFFRCRLALIAFGCVAIHALIFNPDITVFIKLLAIVGVIQWAYIVAMDISFDEFINVLVVSSICVFVFSVIFIVVFPDLSRQYFWGEYVVTSFYSQKNTYGRFLTLAVVFCFFHYLVTKKSLMLLMIAALFLMILATSSRTSLAMSTACIAIVVAIRMRLLNFGFLQLGVAMVVAIFTYGIAIGEVYFVGLGSALDGLAVFGHEIWLTGRSTVWDSLFYQLDYDQRWLFGYGLDRFFGERDLVYQALGNLGLGTFMPSDPHNGYIDAILSYGVVGLLLWVLLLVYLLNSDLVRSLSRNAQAFAMVVIVLMLASNLSESFIVKSTNFYCFLFFYLFFMKLSQDRAGRLAKTRRGHGGDGRCAG